VYVTRKSANTKSVNSYTEQVSDRYQFPVSDIYLVSRVVKNPVNTAVLLGLEVLPNGVRIVPENEVLLRVLSGLELGDLRGA
jgi:hypothetical protein